MANSVTCQQGMISCLYTILSIYWLKREWGWGVGIPQWMKHSPATNMGWVRVQESTQLVRGLSLLLVFSLSPRGFSPGSPNFPLSSKYKNQHSTFQSDGESVSSKLVTLRGSQAYEFLEQSRVILLK